MNTGPAGELERILVLLLILLLIGVGLAWESAAQTALRPEALRLTPHLLLVDVPDIKGRGLAEAEKILEGARLKVGQVTRTPSRSQSGTVIEQTPGAGQKVRSGTAVDVVLAVAPPRPRPELTEVPNLIGHSAERVPFLLRQARLRPGQRQERVADAEAGTVIEQKPGAGQRVEVGGAVDYLLAAAPPRPRPELTEVPNLIGHSAERVPSLLRQARLRPGQRQERVADAEAGTVIEQKPGAGQQVEVGGAVDYLVAAAPLPVRPELTEVPNLIGRSAERVASLLRQARLRPGQRQERVADAQAGTVIEQKPGAGQRVEVGGAVDYLVAAAPPPVRPELTVVPNLLEQGLEEAVTRLTAVRLVAGAVTEQPADRPPGRILQQHPAAGAEVEVGSAVALVVSVAQPEPDTVVVPDLVSRSLAEAGKILASVGLELGVVGERSSEREVGRVLEQSPAADSRVKPGTAVSLVLAAAPMQGVPWVPLVGGLVAAGGVGLLLLRVMRQTKAAGSSAEAFEVVPETDPGTQSLLRTDAGGIAWETELRPIRDEGAQSIEAQGPLVLEEKADEQDR